MEAPHHNRITAMEAAKKVLEAAELGWTAIEFCNSHHRHHHYNIKEEPPSYGVHHNLSSPEEYTEAIRVENARLRLLLQEIPGLSENLHHLPSSPSNLLVTENQEDLSNILQSISRPSITEDDTMDEMDVPRNMNSEEKSDIDDENYVVVKEEHVVDGIANFIAKCIVSNPKAQLLTPEELRIALGEGLKGVSRLEKMVHVWHAGKMLYTFSKWTLTFAGLYQSRGVLKLAVKGVHATAKAVMRSRR